MLTSESMNNFTYKCLKCSVIFSSRDKRDAHIDQFHRTKIYAKFKNNVIRTVIRTMIERFECICERTYVRERDVLRHSKTCNSSNLKAHKKKTVDIVYNIMIFNADNN